MCQHHWEQIRDGHSCFRDRDCSFIHYALNLGRALWRTENGVSRTPEALMQLKQTRDQSESGPHSASIAPVTARFHDPDILQATRTRPLSPDTSCSCSSDSTLDADAAKSESINAKKRKWRDSRPESTPESSGSDTDTTEAVPQSPPPRKAMAGGVPPFVS